jgi:hypothetical protein
VRRSILRCPAPPSFPRKRESRATEQAVGSVTGSRPPCRVPSIRRGENAWCVRVYAGRDAHGKRSYINQTVHGTKRDADQELRKLLAQRDTGRLHVKPKPPVDEYLDVWLETVVRPSVRQRTLHSYDEALRLYVRQNLGRLKLASVTPMRSGRCW